MMSSVAGIRGSANLACYSASKGAVRLFAKSVALECAARDLRVRVNSIHPGYIETPMVAAAIERRAEQRGTDAATIRAELLAALRGLRVSVPPSPVEVIPPPIARPQVPPAAAQVAEVGGRLLEAGRIEAAGAKSLSAGECATLAPDIIHSVINPSARLSASLHIYGGDFANVSRSQWDADTLQEGPYNAEMAARDFAAAIRRTTG